MFYTMGQTAMFYTMGYGSAVPVWVPFGGRHGMATLKPRKAKEGIFKAVVKRYFYFNVVT